MESDRPENNVACDVRNCRNVAETYITRWDTGRYMNGIPERWAVCGIHAAAIRANKSKKSKKGN